ncbi:MAG TPA: hypothetical protein VGP18_08610 [Solirubrobacteraceae bacterium]|jgi:hypothetical protein|nr:hypothetical protein [Solirubrobacteraceae bacterium]
MHVVGFQVRVGVQDLLLAYTSAIIPPTVATGMRRPRMQGAPPIWSELTVILAKAITV